MTPDVDDRAALIEQPLAILGTGRRSPILKC